MPKNGRTATPEPERLKDLLPPGLNEWRGTTKAGVPWEIHRGDAAAVLKTLAAAKFDCVITSPPYFWQRDYHVEGQIGKEETIDAYVKAVVTTMTEVRRVMKKSALLFLNLGDTYYSAKGEPKGTDKKNSARRFGLRAVDKGGLGVSRKTAIGIPWRVAISMISTGWTLRSTIVWHRDKSLPEPTAKDRPWRTYELIFMFSTSPKYHFNKDGLADEQDIWTIPAPSTSSNGYHYATFPEKLVERCLAVGCPPKGTVLDPFSGSGTVLRVALRNNSPAVGIDLNTEYCTYMTRELTSI